MEPVAAIRLKLNFAVPTGKIILKQDLKKNAAIK